MATGDMDLYLVLQQNRCDLRAAMAVFRREDRADAKIRYNDMMDLVSSLGHGGRKYRQETGRLRAIVFEVYSAPGVTATATPSRWVPESPSMVMGTDSRKVLRLRKKVLNGRYPPTAAASAGAPGPSATQQPHRRAAAILRCFLCWQQFLFLSNLFFVIVVLTSIFASSMSTPHRLRPQFVLHSLAWLAASLALPEVVSTDHGLLQSHTP